MDVTKLTLEGPPTAAEFLSILSDEIPLHLSVVRDVSLMEGVIRDPPEEHRFRPESLTFHFTHPMEVGAARALVNRLLDRIALEKDMVQARIELRFRLE